LLSAATIRPEAFAWPQAAEEKSRVNRIGMAMHNLGQNAFIVVPSGEYSS
jgi:hypothetical protein